MKNYIFSTIAAACVFELILEFAPFISNGTVKKYLRYIFALVLALSIVAPFTRSVTLGENGLGSLFETPQSIEAPADIGFIYFEDNGTVCECSETGTPDFEKAVAADMYISECCFGIIGNAKAALANKFSLDKENIRLGISFDATDTSGIEIICAYVYVGYSGEYIQSDCIDYLESALGCKVYRMRG